MRFLPLCAMGLGLLLGCQQPTARLNAPPHGMAERKHDLHYAYAHMVDNALLADMCITDIHFVPHRAMLNSLGEERLSRLATLMQVYGGTIRYSSRCGDDDLVDQRTDAILSFLVDAGIDVDAETVVHDLPGSAESDAAEAILIRERSLKPRKTSDGDGDSLFDR